MSSESSIAHQVTKNRIPYLVLATITMLILGLIYAWSIFATFIGVDFEEYKPLLGQVFQVSMFAFCVSALFGAQLIKRTSFRLTIIVAAILMGIGFVLTALLVDGGVWVLFVCYGIIAASGCGIAYNAIISLVNPWFPDKIGLASGILMMGFGVSSLVFGSLANMLISALGNWRPVFYIIAVVAVVLVVTTACIVKKAPDNIVEIVFGRPAPSADEKPKESPTQAQPILKTRVFWLFSVWATIVIACGLTLIGTSGQGVQALGWDPAAAALLVGLVSTMNGIGRIINGAMFDRIGLVPVMVVAASLAILCMVGLASSLLVGMPVVYAIAAVLVAFPYCAVPVMASAFARQRFGANNFAMNLGIANCNIASAAVINIIIVAIVGPLSVTGATTNGPIIYGILAAMAVVALVFTSVFRKAYRSDLAKIAGELE